MQLKWLEDFLALAETRSFSRTAEMRHVTQPAFGRRIRSLEAWVGAELIDRHAFPPTLTPAGKAFQETAREAVRILQDTREILRNDGKSRSKTVVVATSHTLAITYYPRWIKEIQSRLSNLTSRVIATNAHDGILLLVDGNCDLLMSYHYSQLGVMFDREKFPFLLLGDDSMVPLSAPDADGQPIHCLPGSADKPVAYLAYTPTIFMGHAVEALLQNAPEPTHLQRRYETDMAQALKAMMLEGQGLGWLPLSAARGEIASGSLVCAAPRQCVGHAGESAWNATLELRLYRSLENRKPVLDELWSMLAKRQDFAIAEAAPGQ